jgi:hypothetical protein
MSNPDDSDLYALVGTVRSEADAQAMRHRLRGLAVGGYLLAFMLNHEGLTVMIAPRTRRAAQWLEDNPRDGHSLDAYLTLAQGAGLAVVEQRMK